MTGKHGLIILTIVLISSRSYSAVCTKQPNGIIDPLVDCIPAAPCSGGAVDTDVFNTAMAVLNDPVSGGGALRMPAKVCTVNTTLEIKRGYVSIFCAGSALSCTLRTTEANRAQIVSDQSYGADDIITVNGASVSGLRLDRRTAANQGITLTATAGGDGIAFTGWVNSATIENVSIDHAFNGLVLGPTSVSRVRNIFISNSAQDGIALAPRSFANGNTVQWDIDSAVINGSQRFGIYANSAGGLVGSGHMILGDWRNIQTYYNGDSSVSIQSNSGIPISDLRVDKGWFAGGGPYPVLYEVYLAPGGGKSNRIQNSMVEICHGYGIALDGNSYDVTVSGTKVDGCAMSGILSYAPNLILDGVVLTGNGFSGGAYAGVEVLSGTAVISGLLSTGNYGYGLSMINNVWMAGGNLTGNTIGAVNTNGKGFGDSRFCSVRGVSGHCR
jgi:hypothetical protein